MYDVRRTTYVHCVNNTIYLCSVGSRVHNLCAEEGYAGCVREGREKERVD